MAEEQKQPLNNAEPSSNDIKSDLTTLFDLLRTDKYGPQDKKGDAIDKSTIMALLLYLNLQTDEPEFFSYIKTQLLNNKDSEIKKDDFVKLFLEPQINFKALKNDDMASIFKIFDKDRKGSFSADDFLFYYKKSPEYQGLSKEEQQKVEVQIRSDFNAISAEDKEINPITFYKIINMSYN